MKKTIKEIEEFIKLRVEGVSLRACSKQLNISLSTCLKLAKEHEKEIDNLHAIRKEHLQKEFRLQGLQKLERLGTLSNKVDTAIANVDLANCSLKDLILLRGSINKELEVLLASPSVYKTGEFETWRASTLDDVEKTILLD